MTEVLSFRPGVADSETAFEPMASIYKYLEREYDYNFTIITAESDTYTDNQLDIVSIPISNLRSKVWKSTKYIDRIPISAILPSVVNSYFEKADVVLTVDPTSRATGIIGCKKAIAKGIPVWFDAGRTTMRPHRGMKWRLRHRIYSDLVGDVSGIIATSPKVFEYFRDIGLFNQKAAEKFTVMGHPTDTTKFAPQKESDNQTSETLDILTIARLVPEKGLYYILEALDPILQNREDVRLRIIGEGEMEHLLRRELDDRGLHESVELRGNVPHDQVPEELRSADVFVNHAVDIARWEEFFGAVNIEAMACGLPCILSDSGSIPYVARVSEGVQLVHQRDVTELRESIQYLVNNPDIREEMGRRARTFVEEEYSIEAIGKKYHQMLQREIKN